jgi:hypothetical protein
MFLNAPHGRTYRIVLTCSPEPGSGRPRGMRPLLAGFAGAFNHRRHRIGHLIQKENA